MRRAQWAKPRAEQCFAHIDIAKAGNHLLIQQRCLDRCTFASQGGRQPEFLVTHPYPEHRIEQINATLSKAYPNGVPDSFTRGRKLR